MVWSLSLGEHPVEFESVTYSNYFSLSILEIDCLSNFEESKEITYFCVSDVTIQVQYTLNQIEDSG